MNFLKVPFEYVMIEVEKMYPPHYQLKPGETIEQHLMDIEEFIETCGWTTEEFISEDIHRMVDKLFPDPRKQN